MLLMIIPSRLKPFISAIKLFSRHSETITFFFNQNGLVLQCTNDSKTTFMEVSFQVSFFAQFVYDHDVKCHISVRSLMLVLRAQNLVSLTECFRIEVSDDGNRLTFELKCKNGVFRQYKIPCLDGDVLQYRATQASVVPTMQASARVLLEMLQSFPSSVAEATMWQCQDQVRFKTFLESDDDGQRSTVPSTSFAYSSSEFSQFNYQSDLSITCNIVDLKSFLAFATLQNNEIRVYIKTCSQPVEFAFKNNEDHFMGRMVIATILQDTSSQGSCPPQSGAMRTISRQPVPSQSMVSTNESLECDMSSITATQSGTSQAVSSLPNDSDPVESEHNPSQFNSSQSGARSSATLPDDHGEIDVPMDVDDHAAHSNVDRNDQTESSNDDNQSHPTPRGSSFINTQASFLSNVSRNDQPQSSDDDRTVCSNVNRNNQTGCSNDDSRSNPTSRGSSFINMQASFVSNNASVRAPDTQASFSSLEEDDDSDLAKILRMLDQEDSEANILPLHNRVEKRKFIALDDGSTQLPRNNHRVLVFDSDSD